MPFTNALLRYFILNENGNLDYPNSHWVTPVSEIGIFFAVLTVITFLGVAFDRSARQILFKSRIRHDAFLRAREIEYMLKFSTTYRNERLWMIASYNFAAWPWSIVRTFVDVLLLIVMAFVPNKPGSIIGFIILSLNFLYGFLFVSLHRCVSSNILEHILNFALAIFALFGIFQVFDVRNTLLVDRNLDYFLFGLHGGALGLCLLCVLYFFWDSHKFGKLSLADRRAQAKWSKIFGNVAQSNEETFFEKIKNKTFQAGTWVQLPTYKEDSYLEKEEINEDFAKTLAPTSTADTFYLPRDSGIFSIDASSIHVWPVNGVIINELLRRNCSDHLVDVLRAAHKMLERISALHSTPVLIPTDELKTHIKRLEQCVSTCKRQRVTHHLNAIHPLQTTFEDLIEQFTFELRVFTGRSVTVGHNARKMIEVSRYLRKRMLVRDRTLALVSPLMRRVLVKLLALRIFIQLVEERPQYLMPKQEFKPFESEGSSSDSDTDTEEGKKQPKEKRVDALEGDVFGNMTEYPVNPEHPEPSDEAEYEMAAKLAEAAAALARKNEPEEGQTPPPEGASTPPPPASDGEKLKAD